MGRFYNDVPFCFEPLRCIVRISNAHHTVRWPEIIFSASIFSELFVIFVRLFADEVMNAGHISESVARQRGVKSEVSSSLDSSLLFFRISIRSWADRLG